MTFSLILSVIRNTLNQVEYLTSVTAVSSGVFIIRKAIWSGTILESDRAFWNICFFNAHFCSIILVWSLVSWVFNMLFFTHKLRIDANMSRLLTKIFLSCLECSPSLCLHYEEFGMFRLSPAKIALNFAVFISVNISCCYCENNIVWLLLGLNLIAVSLYRIDRIGSYSRIPLARMFLRFVWIAILSQNSIHPF